MVTLAREFDACGECRLEIGGPLKYRMLTDDEIRTVVLALENMENVIDTSRDLPTLPLTKWQESMASPNVELTDGQLLARSS